MKVLDQEINRQIEKAEIEKNWYLCLSLLELKQHRIERRFLKVIENDFIHKSYIETKIKF